MKRLARLEPLSGLRARPLVRCSAPSTTPSCTAGAFSTHAKHPMPRHRFLVIAAAASWQDYQLQVQRDQEASMQEYLELKQFLLKRCQRFGTFFTLYILLVLSGKAALCTLCGATGSYLYLAWLCYDVDKVKGTDRSPVREAEAIRDVIPRRLAKGVAGYRQALQPRLLVPIALAAGIAWYNAESGDTLSVAEEACVLGGFLSYKIALLLKIWDETKPAFGKRAARRPQWKEIDDSFDFYGREKQKSVGLQEAERILAEEEAKKAAKLSSRQ